MWYLSDIISDLAFVFSYIKEMEAKYEDYGLAIDTAILVYDKHYRVAVTPYETVYSRRSKDTQSDF